MNRQTSITITIGDVANTMRQQRLLKGLPQKAVASALSITQSTLSKIERGVLEPSAIQWMLFCLYVEIPMDIVVRRKLGKP